MEVRDLNVAEWEDDAAVKETTRSKSSGAQTYLADSLRRTRSCCSYSEWCMMDGMEATMVEHWASFES